MDEGPMSEFMTSTSVPEDRPDVPITPNTSAIRVKTKDLTAMGLAAGGKLSAYTDKPSSRTSRVKSD